MTDHRSKTLALGNVTIIIRRPVLSAAEYKRREDSVKAALEAFGRATNSQFVSK